MKTGSRITDGGGQGIAIFTFVFNILSGLLAVTIFSPIAVWGRTWRWNAYLLMPCAIVAFFFLYVAVYIAREDSSYMTFNPILYSLFFAPAIVVLAGYFLWFKSRGK